MEDYVLAVLLFLLQCLCYQKKLVSYGLVKGSNDLEGRGGSFFKNELGNFVALFDDELVRT